MKVLSCSFQSAWLFAMLSTSCKSVHIMLSEQEVTMTRVEFDICLYQSRKLPKAVHSATLLRCWARNIAGGTHTQPGLHGFGGRTGYSISRKHLTSPQLFTEWLSSVMSSATVLNYRYVFGQNSNGTDLYQLVEKWRYHRKAATTFWTTFSRWRAKTSHSSANQIAACICGSTSITSSYASCVVWIGAKIAITQFHTAN